MAIKERKISKKWIELTRVVDIRMGIVESLSKKGKLNMHKMSLR
jgi:hypothetical protein